MGTRPSASGSIPRLVQYRREGHRHDDGADGLPDLALRAGRDITCLDCPGPTGPSLTSMCVCNRPQLPHSDNINRRQASPDRPLRVPGQTHKVASQVPPLAPEMHRDHKRAGLGMLGWYSSIAFSCQTILHKIPVCCFRGITLARVAILICQPRHVAWPAMPLLLSLPAEWNMLGCLLWDIHFTTLRADGGIIGVGLVRESRNVLRYSPWACRQEESHNTKYTLATPPRHPTVMPAHNPRRRMRGTVLRDFSWTPHWQSLLTLAPFATAVVKNNQGT